MQMEEIENRLAALAPRGVMCAFHLRYSRPMRHLMTYPSDWIDTYTRENLIACDPVAIWGIRNTGAMRWSALEGRVPDPLDVFAKGRAHGIAFGAVVACGPPESRSVCGFGRDDRNYTDAELARLEALVVKAHDLLEQRYALRPILLSALEAIGCGMTYDQAAAHLGVSRTALRYRLRTAQQALGAADTQDAIRRAVDAGLLSSNSFTGISRGLPTGPVAPVVSDPACAGDAASASP